jgi:hypothetical protein
MTLCEAAGVIAIFAPTMLPDPIWTAASSRAGSHAMASANTDINHIAFRKACFMHSSQNPGLPTSHEPIGTLIVLPGDGPPFIRVGRPNDEMPIFGELVSAREVLPDEKIACDRSLHMMRDRAARLIHVVASE